MAETTAQNSITADFPQFSLFPTEIRLKIWDFVLHVPRTLTITSPKPTFKTFISGQPRPAQSFYSSLPPPSLLHVNHETRSEALSVYRPYFKTSRRKDNEYKDPTYTSGQSYIYVNFALDTLRFADAILSYLAETELQGIQSLILDVKDCAYFGHFNMDIVKRMKGLREVVCWAERGDIYSWQGGDAYLRQLLAAFEDAKEGALGWECPVVRIFNRESGLEVGGIKGGAKVPGWTEDSIDEPDVA